MFAQQGDFERAARLLVDAQKTLLGEYLKPRRKGPPPHVSKELKPSGDKEFDDKARKMWEMVDSAVDDLFERYAELLADKPHRLAEGLVKCAAVYEKYGIPFDDEAKAALKEILDAVE